MDRFKLTPMAHQLAYLNKHERDVAVMLAADMGTGKTKCIIDNIAGLWSSGDLDAVIVFAPKGVHTNWTLRELPKHMPDFVRYKARAYSSGMSTKSLKKFNELYDNSDSSELRIMVANWDSLITESGLSAAKRFCETCSRLMIVGDESHNIKNPSAARTKRLMKLKPLSTYRRLMTGTPISNSPFDAFSQYMFLDESILQTTSYYAFKAEYAEMLTENHGLIQGIVRKKIKLSDSERRTLNDSFNSLKTMLVQNGRPELLESFSSIETAYASGDYEEMASALEETKNKFSPVQSHRRQMAMAHIHSMNSVISAYTRRAANAFSPNRIPQIIAKDKKGKKKYRNLDKLKTLIEPFTFRVLKKDCLDLPEKIYKTSYFEMSKEQAEIYRKAKEEGRLTLNGEDTPFNRMVIYMKLAQITSGYFLHPEQDEPVRIPGATNKLDLLDERVQAIMEEGSQCIIWARYHVELDDICKRLKDAGVDFVEYHGRVSEKDRSLAIDRFQSGEARVFVGQQKAGGSGITLTSASYVIYFSNTFSLIDREQSEDRAHRIGQTKNVVYFNLIAQGTIDEEIVSALQDKREIASITLSFDSNKADN